MDALKKLLVSLALVSAVALPVAQAAEGAREWKTADGTRTLQAEYVSSRDGKVTIRRDEDGKTFTIGLDSLSEEDREWVEAKEKELAASGPREVSEKFADLISGEWERTEGHGLQYRIYGDRKLRRSEEGGYPLVVLTDPFSQTPFPSLKAPTLKASDLPKMKKTDLRKAAVVWALKTQTAIGNDGIRERLSMGHATNVSNAARIFRERGNRGEAAQLRRHLVRAGILKSKDPPQD